MRILPIGVSLACSVLLCACAGLIQQPAVRVVEVANGWAANSVNAVVFRKNSLVTHEGSQYIAFYDAAARLVLGKRRLGELAWQLAPTQYLGKASDAHNSISIMVDGAGYVHVAWDHHNGPLRYARGTAPGALALGRVHRPFRRSRRPVAALARARLRGRAVRGARHPRRYRAGQPARRHAL